MMELKDTVKLMNSDDFKDRFVAEYLQTKIRYNKLHDLLVKYEAETLDFQLKSPYRILIEQKSYMGRYLNCLEVRAQIEGIQLPSLGFRTEEVKK